MTCSRALFCRGRSRPLAVRYRQPKFNPNRAILSSERNLPPIAVSFQISGLRIVAQLAQSGANYVSFVLLEFVPKASSLINEGGTYAKHKRCRTPIVDSRRRFVRGRLSPLWVILDRIGLCAPCPLSPR